MHDDTMISDEAVFQPAPRDERRMGFPNLRTMAIDLLLLLLFALASSSVLEW